MSFVQQQRRSRGSQQPKLHYADGHIIRRTEREADYEIVRRVFGAHRRYASAEYAAALTGRSYDSIRGRFTDLREMQILKLCDRQIESDPERIIGTLYNELGPRGQEIAAELGIELPDRRSDAQFSHTLMLDQVTASLEIGLAQQGTVTMAYRTDLPRSLPLASVGGKARWITPDSPHPITLTNTTNGKRRHIAGIEIETGSNRIHSKDADRTAVVHKFQHMLYVMQSGVLEAHYHFGNTFFWAFVFGSEAAKRSAMGYLAEMTKSHADARAHFLFKSHPVYGKKSSGKPRATGHIATEPWARVERESLYLAQPKES